jgi:hypothetical protein
LSRVAIGGSSISYLIVRGDGRVLTGSFHGGTLRLGWTDNPELALTYEDLSQAEAVARSHGGVIEPLETIPAFIEYEARVHGLPGCDRG